MEKSEKQLLRKIFFRIFTLENQLKNFEKEKSQPLQSGSADHVIELRNTIIELKSQELHTLNTIINDFLEDKK